MSMGKVTMIPNDRMKLNQKTLMLDVPGLVIVYFMIAGDKFCTQFDAVFSEYAKRENRLTCVCIDVSDRVVTTKSKNSTTPIKSVPSTILYVDGYPRAKISPASTPSSFLQAVNKVFNNIRDQQSQPSQQSLPRLDESRSAPSYMSKPHVPESYKSQAPMGYAEQDNGDDLLMPADIIPHNAPWEADLR